MNNKYYFLSLLFLIINLFISCGSDIAIAGLILEEEEQINYKYGYDE